MGMHGHSFGMHACTRARAHRTCSPLASAEARPPQPSWKKPFLVDIRLWGRGARHQPNAVSGASRCGFLPVSARRLAPRRLLRGRIVSVLRLRMLQRRWPRPVSSEDSHGSSALIGGAAAAAATWCWLRRYGGGGGGSAAKRRVRVLFKVVGFAQRCVGAVVVRLEFCGLHRPAQISPSVQAALDSTAAFRIRRRMRCPSWTDASPARAARSSLVGSADRGPRIPARLASCFCSVARRPVQTYRGARCPAAMPALRELWAQMRLFRQRLRPKTPRQLECRGLVSKPVHVLHRAAASSPAPARASRRRSTSVRAPAGGAPPRARRARGDLRGSVAAKPRGGRPATRGRRTPGTDP